jgi:hypothetical protein
VVSEKYSIWGPAIEVPGLRALGGSAGVSELSCPSAGNCLAIEAPGLGALN